MGCPVPGRRVTTPHGLPGSWAAGRHTGEDYAANSGEPVVATCTARVSFVGITGGWGDAYGLHVITENPDGTRSAYCHLSKARVLPGDQLGPGDRIGDVGTTGNSTGPHLHYEERRSPFSYGADRAPHYSHQEDDMPLTDAEIDRIAAACASRVNGVLGDFDQYGKKRDGQEGERGDVRLRQIENMVSKIKKKLGA